MNHFDLDKNQKQNGFGILKYSLLFAWFILIGEVILSRIPHSPVYYSWN